MDTKMANNINCVISFVIIVSQILLLYFSNYHNSTKNFVDKLDDTQKEKFKEVLRERFTLYLEGTFVGFLFFIALMLILIMLEIDIRKCFINNCVFIILIFVIQFSYYLYVKKEHNLDEILKDETLKKEWDSVLEQYQYNLVFAIFIGFVFYFFLNGISPNKTKNKNKDTKKENDISDSFMNLGP